MAYILEEETFKIRQCIYEVHRQMGCGFSEKLYQDALEYEFILQGIPYERERHLTFNYKGKVMEHDYFLDFLCYGQIIVELKAVHELENVHKAQVYNYLRATDLDVALLANFGDTKCQIERLFNFYKNKNG